ncbi:DUF2878 domain-containing protein [Vibrio vulnificus]|nr:DUF2878 domain-containing protein [Vibrio vulnificus]HDY7475331.1 DUF2878 domain-containing protein [Vibrio vulnificus]
MALILASAWFNLVWFLAVIGTEQWQWVTLCFALMTLGYQYRVDPKTWKATLLIAVVGCLVDSLNQYLSIFQFTSTFLPVWLLSLWVVFAWYAYHLKRILLRFAPFYVLTAGALGGCLSYYAGYKLNAVTYGYSVLITASIVFLEWAIITLFIIKVLRHDEKSKLCHSEYVS